MPSPAPKKISGLADYVDTKADILAKLGDVSGFEIAGNEVLLASYQRPEKTPGGIVQTHRALKEDIYQGKVGLVVKIGESCRFEMVSETGIKYGIPIKLHDWVVVRPSDTWSLDINGNPDVLSREDFVTCRMVYPHHIRARISNPALVG